MRVYDAPKGSAILIFIDNTSTCFEDEEQLCYADLACECAASVAKAASLSGFAATVISGRSDTGASKYTQSVTVNPSDTRGLTMLLHHLVRLPFSGKEDSGNLPVPQIPAESHTKAVFVLSGMQDSGLYKQIRALFSQHRTPVKQLLLGQDTGGAADKSSNVLPVPFGEDLNLSLGGRIWE